MPRVHLVTYTLITVYSERIARNWPGDWPRRAPLLTNACGAQEEMSTRLQESLEVQRILEETLEANACIFSENMQALQNRADAVVAQLVERPTV